MLRISNLCVSLETKTIISDLALLIQPGTVHAIMGPNGSGKSSLASAIMGHPSFSVDGSISLHEQEIVGLPIDQRAKRGIFLAYQHPIAIPGVSVQKLLHESYRAIHGTQESIVQIDMRIQEAAQLLAIDQSWLTRSVHEGFSGGEKKRLELLQLMVLRPQLAILDEIDSGLDIDALTLVCAGIARARQANPSMSIILITHYPRILNYLNPDHVHVMTDGKIVESGDMALAMQLEKKGYQAYGFSDPS